MSVCEMKINAPTKTSTNTEDFTNKEFGYFFTRNNITSTTPDSPNMESKFIIHIIILYLPNQETEKRKRKQLVIKFQYVLHECITQQKCYNFIKPTIQ